MTETSHHPSPARPDGRAPDDLRPLEIVPGAVPFAEGSALVKLGRTHVLCAATVEDRLPRWLMGQGRGWVTAEYSMLPRATRGGFLRGRRPPASRAAARSRSNA